MRREEFNDVYKLFDLFLNEFLLSKNSILSNHNNILNKHSISDCINRYIDNGKLGNQRFGEKIREQFNEADLDTKLVFAHCEWVWGYSVSDITEGMKQSQVSRTTGLDLSELKSDIFTNGFGSSGQYHKTNKYNEIIFVIRIIEFLYEKIDAGEVVSVDEAKKWIESICLYQKYSEGLDGFELQEHLISHLYDGALATANVLLYITNPDNYERIASDAHKRNIVGSFYSLLDEHNEEALESANLDAKILLIREALSSITGEEDIDFYQEKFRKVWNYTLSEEGFDEIQGLQYKKAVILYGPPGTSKTYTAERLARALITNEYISTKDNIRSYLEGKANFIEKSIHHLQLHSNYNYEDFVAGIHLVDNETKAVPGKLFEICKAAEKDVAPHVLILDEINRVDLSRLFGEVFSALENRGKKIDLSIGGLTLTIPENLYVIGTMNEIDFSLEQIDFALRRRFLWFFYGYNADTLRSIIYERNKSIKPKIDASEIDRFITQATALNETVSNLPELGPQYEIGHTFFAEVAEIYSSYIRLRGNVRKLSNPLFRKGGPAKILWDISLKPVIDAFLGNMDRETKKSKIEELKILFLHG